MAMKLTPDERTSALDSISRFFEEVLDEDIGELKATLVLNYVVKEIGPSIYNHAVADAKRWFLERIDDVDGSCFEPEFPYWRDD